MTHEKRPQHRLSKTSFLRGVQCKKSLYLDAHHPELREPLSAASLRRMREGQRVHAYARQRFPGGVFARPEAPFDFDTALAQTAAALRGEAPALYEAAFKHRETLAFVDLLVRVPGGWRLYEVKSTTQVKEQHVWDVALQLFVLTGAGVTVTDALVMHPNSNYVRSGELDLNALFLAESVYEMAQMLQPEVAREIEACLAVLESDRTPEVDIGPYCRDPVECDFIAHCWAHVPERSVFEVHRLSTKKKFALYHQGVLHMRDIPADYPLGEAARFHVEHEATQQAERDTVALRSFLSGLRYPLYFLDFETFMVPIPPFDGTRPYSQVPYQYSLHVQKSQGGEAGHSGYLAPAGEDPRRPLLEQLLRETAGPGHILVYNKAFEAGRLKELAEQFPDSKPAIEERLGRLVDLMDPFRKRIVYLPEMHGSYSIKAVLPALVPDLDYDHLEVANGADAMEAYLSLQEERDPGVVDRVREALWEYCKLDTLAMVRILERLYALAE